MISSSNTTYIEIDPLTKRELEALHFISQGYSSKEISGMMYCSYHTVIDYRKALMRKFDARNMVHLIYLAIKADLLDVQSRQAAL